MTLARVLSQFALLVGLLGLLSPIMVAGPVPSLVSAAQPTPTQPPPSTHGPGGAPPGPQVHPAIYGLHRGVWTRTRTVSLAQPVLFAIQVQRGVQGFTHPTVSVSILAAVPNGSTGTRQPGTSAVDRFPLTLVSTSRRWFLFEARHDFIAHRLLGQFFAAFDVHGGAALERAFVPFSVRATGK